MAPPAPASEAGTAMVSAFLVPTATTLFAAPLSELDCNDCQLACKLPPAMRRGASFLDAGDACMALPDKTSFLIPEDSYFPGQENDVLRSAPPASASGCISPSCPSATSTHAVHALPSRPHHPSFATGLRSPFLLADMGLLALPGEEDFVSASVCFEKAVQELEMVERPASAAAGLAGSSHACLLPTLRHSSIAPCAGGGACFDLGSSQPGLQLLPPRDIGSLAPSPAASAGQQQHGGASAGGSTAESSTGDADAVTSACAELSSAAAAEMAAGAGAPMSLQAPMDWWQQQQQAGLAEAADRGREPESVPVSPAAPAAPAPAARAFHHKTGGPCDHCGATESPQWRRGPPAKPMLCNACGTRFRRTNQLNPASANSAAARAAAASAAGATAAAAAGKGRGTKRESSTSGGAPKRGRAAYY